LLSNCGIEGSQTLKALANQKKIQAAHMSLKLNYLPFRKHNSDTDLHAIFYLFLLLIHAGFVDRAS